MCYVIIIVMVFIVILNVIVGKKNVNEVWNIMFFFWIWIDFCIYSNVLFVWFFFLEYVL